MMMPEFFWSCVRQERLRNTNMLWGSQVSILLPGLHIACEFCEVGKGKWVTGSRKGKSMRFQIYFEGYPWQKGLHWQHNWSRSHLQRGSRSRSRIRSRSPEVPWIFSCAWRFLLHRFQCRSRSRSQMWSPRMISEDWGMLFFGMNKQHVTQVCVIETKPNEAWSEWLKFVIDWKYTVC